MEMHNWFLFASIIALASISPGPNVLAVIVNAFDAGIRGAFFTILGNLLALFTIALAAASGVGAILQAAPSVFTIMKVAGGLYLIWMGIKMLKSSFQKFSSLDLKQSDRPAQKTENRPKTTNVEFMVRAMLISYSNPKSILFLSAVFPTFLNKTSSVPLQFGIMFVTLICIVTSIHSLYATLALRVKGGQVSANARKLMARLSGISFVGFGAGFIYDSQK